MSYPMRAFRRVSTSTAPAGSLLRIRDFWAMKVAPDEEDEEDVDARDRVLVLSGEHAGAVVGFNQDVAISLAENFGWQIFFDSFEGKKQLETYPAVRLTGSGPVIYGHEWNDRMHWHSFDIDGKQVNDGTETDYIYDFQIWLVDANLCRVGTEPLVRLRGQA